MSCHAAPLRQLITRPYPLSLTLVDAGVPCIPGYHGANQDPQHLLSEAQKIGTDRVLYSPQAPSFSYLLRFSRPYQGCPWRRW